MPTSLVLTDCGLLLEKFWHTGGQQSSAHVCGGLGWFQADQQVAFVPVLERERDTLPGQKTLEEEDGASGGGRDSGFPGQEDGVSTTSPSTVLLKAPQVARCS